MFAVKIQGRLGNQMFQYAFAIAQQKRLKQTYYLDSYKYFFWNKYFILDKYFNINHTIGFTNLLRKIFFYCRHFFNPPVFTQDQWEHPTEVLKAGLLPEILYEGFFQSEDFFKEYKEILLKEFEVKPAYKMTIADFTGNKKENIVLHIRRGDYLNWGNDELGYNLSLPLEYYERCISMLETSDRNIIFLSDDIEFVKQHLPMKSAFYADKNNEITDFQLIMQADYLILSNSSFSWWGAYLNTRAKRILAPKYWLGFKVEREWPNKVICENWEPIVVKDSHSNPHN